MKTIFRSIIFYSISLYLVSGLFTGLKITAGLQTIFTGGAILAAMSLILRPILQIIAFPINVMTLGLFSFVINAGLLYLMTHFVSTISIHAFTFEHLSYKFISIPKISFNIFFAFIFLSFMISFFVTILTWLTTD